MAQLLRWGNFCNGRLLARVEEVQKYGGQAPTSMIGSVPKYKLQKKNTNFCAGATSATAAGLRRYKNTEARPPHRGIDDRECAKIQTWVPSYTKQNIARVHNCPDTIILNDLSIDYHETNLKKAD